jgi:hypothetical protein
VVAVVGVGLVALLSMGQAARSRTVEAERFVLKDRQGKIRAVLGESPDDEIGLVVYDARQRPGAVIAVRDGGFPVVELRDATGVPKVTLDLSTGLAVSGDGPRVTVGVHLGTEPTVQLSDKDGWTRASLSLATGPSPAPILKFLDPRGDARMWLGAMSDGKAQLLMMGRPPRVREAPTAMTVLGTATLEVDSDGAGTLRFRHGGTRWTAP